MIKWHHVNNLEVFDNRIVIQCDILFYKQPPDKMNGEEVFRLSEPTMNVINVRMQF